MSYGTLSIANPGTITDGCGSKEIVNPATSRSAPEMERKPRLPTDADTDQDALDGETLF